MADAWLQEPILTNRWQNEPEMDEKEVARYAFGQRESLNGGPQNDPLTREQRAADFREKANRGPPSTRKTNAAKLAEAFGMTLDEYRQAHSTAFADISGTEMNKQRALATQEVFTRKGLPNTQDTGPLGTVFKMADIKAPRGTFGTSRRKSRKLKKKRTKKTRKH